MAHTVTLNNGMEMPILGLGTWLSEKGVTAQAVKDAIDIGYRHIDCSPMYKNEKEIGEALNEKIEEGVITRNDIFVTSKLWNTFHRPDLVEKGLLLTLADLNLEYVDLFLMHWPFAFREEVDVWPLKDGKLEFSDVDYVDTWKAMEEMVKKGLVKAIGISNFNRDQIERVLAVAEIKPVTNQVECHPYLPQKKLMEFCMSHDIILTAYSPLGSPENPWAKDPVLLEDPTLTEIAERLGKNTGQILIRYQVQRGIPVIPKSVRKERIRGNFEIFDFELSDEDMETLNGLDKGSAGRYVDIPEFMDHKYYPFVVEY